LAPRGRNPRLAAVGTISLPCNAAACYRPVLRNRETATRAPYQRGADSQLLMLQQRWRSASCEAGDAQRLAHTGTRRSHTTRRPLNAHVGHPAPSLCIGHIVWHAPMVPRLSRLSIGWHAQANTRPLAVGCNTHCGHAACDAQARHSPAGSLPSKLQRSAAQPSSPVHVSTLSSRKSTSFRDSTEPLNGPRPCRRQSPAAA
jgi:hypothetical protein